MRLALPIILGFLAHGVSAACTIGVDSAAIFPANRGIGAVRFANISGGPFRDLVGMSDGGLTVMPGGPDATFGAPSPFEFNANITSFGVTDIDHDGDDDVVAYDGSEALVYRNDLGVLTRAAAIPIPRNDAVLVAGDFDGDGNGDFAYVSPAAGALTVQYGRGDFTFYSMLLPFPSNTLAGRLLVADLDRDGTDDLVVTNGNLFIYFGSRGGVLPVGAFDAAANSAVAGDFDGDGKTDLALGAGARLTFMFNAGAGREATFSPPADGVFYGEPRVAADLDGDGIDDIVADGLDSVQVIHVTRGAVHDEGFFLANGPPPAGMPASGLAADLDGDGTPEVVIPANGNVVVFRSDGHGGLRAPRFVLSSFDSRPIAAADFNDDGLDDYLDQSGLFFSNGDGTFRRGSGPALNALGAAVGDLNGDGKLDVVFLKTGMTGGLAAATALGTGDGLHVTNEVPLDAWRLKASYSLDVFAGPTLADVDGDGNLDFLAVVDGGVIGALGNGDGTFGPVVKLTDYTGAANKTQAGDANGDGRLDLMTGGYLALNLGGGRFATPTFSFDCAQRFTLFVDFTRDGLPDCISTTLGGLVAPNRGDGTFQGFVLSEPLINPTSFEVRDFNHDGCADILAAGRPGFSVLASDGYIAMGDCRGSFSAPVSIFPTPGKVLAGDFNGDGTLDLLDGGFLRLGSCTGSPHRAARH